MGLLSKNNNTGITAGSDNTTDPTYASGNTGGVGTYTRDVTSDTNAAGMNQGGYQDEGMGMGSGHYNNTMPGGGTGQGQYVPPPDEHQRDGFSDGYGGHSSASYVGTGPTAAGGDYATGGSPGDNVSGNRHQDNVKHDAEGAAIGGVAGHEYNKHHDGGSGPGTRTGAAAGAFGGHEYNKHHDSNSAGTGTGAGYRGSGPGVGAGVAGGGLAAHEYNKHCVNDRNTATTTGGPYVANNQASAYPGNAVGIAGASSQDPIAEGKHLERTGKAEKALGTVLFSSTLKEKGVQKQMEGARILQQAHHSAMADNLEGQARIHRAHAEGLRNAGPAAAGVPTTGVQPSYGTRTDGIVGGGVGGLRGAL